MRATLETVARLAGVSTSTASRALTGDPRVLPATKLRVREAAATLRYHPNRMASALRTRRTGLVGLVVNSLHNSTFTAIAEVIQAHAVEDGYQVLVCSTEDDPAREAAFLDTALEHHLDGVIIAGTGTNVERINNLLEYGTAVVTMNRAAPGAGAPSVLPDHRAAARLATEHLIRLGHTRIGTVAAFEHVTSGREHHAGLCAALTGAGLPLPPDLVQRGPFTSRFGRDAGRALTGIARPPTALVVSNHEATAGVLPTLVEVGVRVPEDLSVVCTEDAPWYGWWQPRLTAVDIRAGDLARSALRLLQVQLTGDQDQATPHLVITPSLIARQSTGPPARGG